MKKILCFVMFIWVILLSACGINANSKVVGEYDVTRLSVAFPSHDAYAIGANAKGMPIFKDPKKALEQAKKDYALGFSAIAKEHHLRPVTNRNFEQYMTYGWQIQTEDPSIHKQGAMITRFFDIYENGF